MYVLNERGIQELNMYKTKVLSEKIGISVLTLREIRTKHKPILKLPAYAITKFLDSEAEIKDYFIIKEK